jgi:NAD(P)H dehydrogenase (quinone)
MQDTNVLVTFCSRLGSTERLALAAALGAVQARANIRLRWLREIADDEAVDRTPGWRENRDRMAKEYIAPREIDFLWADALVIAIPAGVGMSSPELSPYFESLQALQSAGKLHVCAATALTAGSAEAAFADLGLTLVPLDQDQRLDHNPTLGSNQDAVESARLQGRRVTEAARARKHQ